MNWRPLTRPALAVNTMSGTPGCGSRSSISAPAVRSATTSPSHSCRARSRSTATSSCIHALISYRTPKCSGGHIRKRRPHDSSVTSGLAPSGQVVDEVAQEETHVGDDAHGLMAAPVGQLGDDGVVDVDAER